MFFEDFLLELAALRAVDWAATLTAVVYVVLAARVNPWCWVWGMVSCALWAYASFFFYHLWLDAILQLFYVAMAFVGWYRWQFGGAQQSALPVTRLRLRQHLPILLFGGLATLVFGYFFGAYTPAAATYADAFTTVFSVIATFMLIQKKLENWLYWIVTDLAYVWLYGTRGAYLFALLMVVYTVIAIVAYRRWQKI